MTWENPLLKWHPSNSTAQGFSKIRGSHSRIHHWRHDMAVLGDADSVSLPGIPLHGWSRSENIFENIIALDRMLRYAMICPDASGDRWVNLTAQQSSAEMSTWPVIFYNCSFPWRCFRNRFDVMPIKMPGWPTHFSSKFFMTMVNLPILPHVLWSP